MSDYTKVEFTSEQGDVARAAVVQAKEAKADPVQAVVKALEPVPPKPPEAKAEGEMEQPSLILGKFKSHADLEAAYKALESKLGAKPEANKEPPKVKPDDLPPDPKKGSEEKPKTEGEKGEAKEDSKEDSAADALTEVGLNFDEFSKEYSEKGTLTDASYEKLGKAGIPRNIVDQYISNQIAAAELAEVKLIAETGWGSKDNLSSAMKWASANWDGVESYNQAISTNNPEAVKLALASLKTAYDNSMAAGPKLVQGGPARADSDRYESMVELTTDMRKPEYHNDPAFRAKVEAKLRRSQI